MRMAVRVDGHAGTVGNEARLGKRSGVTREALAMGSKKATAEVNLAQLFRNRSAQYGDRVRWKQKRDGVWLSKTWKENQQLVNRLISGLDALGARAGDVIGIASGTRW